MDHSKQPEISQRLKIWVTKCLGPQVGFKPGLSGPLLIKFSYCSGKGISLQNTVIKLNAVAFSKCIDKIEGKY